MVLILDKSSEHGAVRFVEDIWLHRQSRQIRFFLGKDQFYLKRAQQS